MHSDAGAEQRAAQPRRTRCCACLQRRQGCRPAHAPGFGAAPVPRRRGGAPDACEHTALAQTGDMRARAARAPLSALANDA